MKSIGNTQKKFAKQIWHESSHVSHCGSREALPSRLFFQLIPTPPSLGASTRRAVACTSGGCSQDRVMAICEALAFTTVARLRARLLRAIEMTSRRPSLCFASRRPGHRPGFRLREALECRALLPGSWLVVSFRRPVLTLRAHPTPAAQRSTLQHFVWPSEAVRSPNSNPIK